MSGRARRSCPVCGRLGTVRWGTLSDRLGQAPGAWSLRTCGKSGCGLLWLDPLPDPEDLRAAYASYYTVDPPRSPLARGIRERVARGYLALRFGYPPTGVRSLIGFMALLHPGERQAIESEVMYLPYLSRGRLLEIGFGDAHRLRVLGSLGWDVCGIDADERAALLARRSSGLRVCRWSSGFLPFRDASFEAVVLAHTVEHLPDPLLALREVRRVLRPDGIAVVTTPNVRSALAAVFNRHYFPLDPPRHLVLFDARSLAFASRTAGLQVNRIFTSTRNAASTLWASLRLARGGRFDLREKPRLGLAPWAWAYHWIAALCTVVSPRFGDELVLIARRHDPRGEGPTRGGAG